MLGALAWWKFHLCLGLLNFPWRLVWSLDLAVISLPEICCGLHVSFLVFGFKQVQTSSSWIAGSFFDFNVQTGLLVISIPLQIT